MLSKRTACAVLMLFLPLAAGAQASERPDPADPKLGVSAIRYESPFAGYRAFTDEKVLSWRAANELVLKLGGWRAFAQDKVPDVPPLTAPAADAVPQGARPTEPAPAKPAPAPAKPAPGGHSGHR